MLMMSDGGSVFPSHFGRVDDAEKGNKKGHAHQNDENNVHRIRAFDDGCVVVDTECDQRCECAYCLSGNNLEIS